MVELSQFEELAKKLSAALPASVQNFENEIQQKFREILQSAFVRMDLVTREEFDVQLKVLARTREKVDSLQKQIDALLSEHKDDNALT
ncbi:ubiquinone biosynthesis accessory factor UbiK [Legionella oakridgensis]|uniref:Ubiquinone biosynthesis accessory factor UbiK n=2 Tax=Legionella oakridgensis TaxID=29423 RepID=W0BHN9_9GAMM|nr:accessory factor UbiK family protein [Legionella oakridgensis]AHE67919.1 hypothetical protein Loa_02377 [Legionella oakridgensis ATCC 33761 = DSM 21215]ETO92552.1 hypothetical protein LOR_63c16380 [Legionella oakridgensis RV-2-2007]KTD38740.1 Membrane fusogenic activity [Legionella oakridgensis]STY20924.1 Uncharacterized protein conserved in bacteria [Legionella longbeachae]